MQVFYSFNNNFVKKYNQVLKIYYFTLTKPFTRTQLYLILFSEKANFYSSVEVFIFIQCVISIKRCVNIRCNISKYKLRKKYYLCFIKLQVEGIRANKGRFQYTIWKESFDCLYKLKPDGSIGSKIDTILLSSRSKS